MNKLTVFEFDGQEITLDAKMGMLTFYLKRLMLSYKVMLVF